MANSQDRSEVVVMIMGEAEKLPEEFNEEEMIHLLREVMFELAIINLSFIVN